MEVLVVGGKHFDSKVSNSIINTFKYLNIIRWQEHPREDVSMKDFSRSVIDRVIGDKNITDLVIHYSVPSVIYYIAHWVGRSDCFDDRITVHVIHKNNVIEKINTKGKFPGE